MTLLHQQPTMQADWYTLIIDAENECSNIEIDNEIKAYLLALLQRFMEDKKLAETIVGHDYLQGLQAQGIEQKIILRNVGDKCLLISGLFPEQAKRRNVSVVYYIDVGVSAYGQLSEIHTGQPNTSELYSELQTNFNQLVELLSYIREMPNESKFKSAS